MQCQSKRHMGSHNLNYYVNVFTDTFTGINVLWKRRERQISQVNILSLQIMEITLNRNFAGGGTLATFQSCVFFLIKVSVHHCM